MMRRYIDIIESMENSTGSIRVLDYDKSTRTVTVDGGEQFKLSDNVIDEPTPGFNYAFVIKNGIAKRLMSLTVDVVVTDGQSILLIKRGRDPFAGHWALPGGFVDPGETAEIAARRELEEETGVTAGDYHFKHIGTFDEPHRDPRMESVISNAFLAKIPRQHTQAGDDASAAEWVPLAKLQKLKLAFDHKQIIQKAGLL